MNSIMRSENTKGLFDKYRKDERKFSPRVMTEMNVKKIKKTPLQYFAELVRQGLSIRKAKEISNKFK